MEGQSDEDATLLLSWRLLELEIKGSWIAVAECEQGLAVSKSRSANNDKGSGDKSKAATQLEGARERLRRAELSLLELTSAITQTATDDESALSASFIFLWNGKDGPKKSDEKKRCELRSLLLSILDGLAEQENPPSYRGAIGYPAKLDTKKEMFED